MQVIFESLFNFILLHQKELIIAYLIGALIYSMIGFILISKSKQTDESMMYGFCFTILAYPLAVLVILITALGGMCQGMTKDINNA